MATCFHNKSIDMLKIGCTLPNFKNNSLHESTTAKFYPFIEDDNDLWEKNRQELIAGTSIVFSNKTIVDETLFYKSSNM